MKIIITGASSGIGEHLFRVLVDHELWGVGRRELAASAVPQTRRYDRCDLTDWEQVSRLAQDVRSSWSNLDGLIHCAGTQGSIGPAMNLDAGEWVNAVRANIEPAFYVIKAFYPLLVERSSSRAKLILFSGGGASKARPNFSAYACAKTALVRLTETLAQEWDGYPIDVNIIAPGAINTNMTQEVARAGPERAGAAEYRRAIHQLKHGADSIEKVIQLVRFLLAADSDGISGKFLSAQWDSLDALREIVRTRSDAFTLRRLT